MRFILTTLIVIFLAFTATAQSPIFEFECFSNANMTGDSCDICVGTSFQSRSFNGLMVYRLGVFNRWIDEPYLIRLRPGNSVEFIEQVGTNPDRITIPLNQTGFSTISGFIDSTFCAGANVDFSFFASDSLRTTAINYLDTIKIVGRGGTTVFFDTLTQKYIITSPSAAAGTNLSFTGTSSPVTLNSSTGTDVNFVAGTSISLAATGTDLTITNTAPNINQTISTTGAAGNITLSDGGGTLNLNVNDADASPTNEIQTLSYSAPNLSLNLGGGSVAIPQGTVTGTGTANKVAYWNSTTALTATNLFGFDGSNLAVGTTTISDRVSVSGDIGSNNLFLYRNSGTNAIVGRFGNAAMFNNGALTDLGFRSTGNLLFGTTGSVNSQMIITNAGNVGIGGILSPTYGLQYYKAAGSARMGIYSDFSGGTSGSPSYMGIDYQGYNGLIFGSITGVDRAGSLLEGGLAFFADPNITTPSQTLRMFIEGANGNVGIGTGLTTSAKLDVAGNFKLTTRTGTAVSLSGWGSDNICRDVAIGSGLSLSGGTLSSTAGANAWVYDGNTIGSNKRIGSNDAFAVAIETNNTDRMYFDNAGKIGIGNTAPEVTMDFDGTTDGIVLPSGSAAQRPTILGNFVTRNLRYLGAFGLEISDNSNRYHLLSSGTTPSYVVGAAAGTGGGAAAGTGGNELSSLVTITVGTAPTAGGVVFTRTFASVMTHAPTVVFSAGNSLTASEITKFYALATTSGYTLYSNATLQVGTNNYVLNIQVRN